MDCLFGDVVFRIFNYRKNDRPDIVPGTDRFMLSAGSLPEHRTAYDDHQIERMI